MRYLNGKELRGAGNRQGGALLLRHRRGFALVATLTLMMLLGLIAVGILAVASTQNRIAAQTILLAEARQQALIGLDAAISDLQMEMGPDQRVSAPSGITSDNTTTPQHILGVWDSWTAPLYGRAHGGSISGTYQDNRSSMFRRWLISCSSLDTQHNFSALSDLGRSKPGRRICMVGEGTLGTKVSEKQYVYADLITMPSAGRNETCFAWWVGGENQKANVAVQPREETDDPVEILHRTWDTPPPSFRNSTDLSFLPEEIEEPGKLLTLRTLPLVERGAMQAGQPYFFDVTTLSYSLLTNVRDGGLKLDLNLLLNKRSLQGTGLQARHNQDCPIAEGEGLPVGSESAMPIGSWQNLHAYYNTWPDGSASNRDFSNRLSGTVMSAYTRLCGDLESGSTQSGDSVTFFDTRARENDLNAGYARTPVMLAFLGQWGLHSSNDGGDVLNVLRYVYSPVMLWWNPYNVDMKVRAKKLWAYTLPYRTTFVENFNKDSFYRGGSSSPQSSDPPKAQWQANPQAVLFDDFVAKGQRAAQMFPPDWGSPVIGDASGGSKDVEFGPGEILAFTLKGTRDVKNASPDTPLSEVIGTPQDSVFVPGDLRGGERSDYSYFMYYIIQGSEEISKNGFQAKLSLENRAIAPQASGTGNGPDKENHLWHVTMGEIMMKGGAQNTFKIGTIHTAGDGREAFTVVHGYDGLEISGAKLEESYVDRFVGARGIAPSNFSLGWYDYTNMPADSLVFMDEEWTLNMEEPQYYVAVGVAPKSYNKNLLEALPYFNGKDYRSKVWQHSSPAFWSSAIYRPDDQQRQYHPFQLTAIKLSDGQMILDTVNDHNGVYGITLPGTGGGEAISYAAVLELPMHPPFSLAGFAGMRLTPGWYGNTNYSGTSSIAQMRRMQYQAGVPGVGIGNSFADPVLPADDVYIYRNTDIPSDIASNGRLFSDFYDHGLIINDALWDRWFCSSVSDMPSGNGRIKAEETLNSFVSGSEPLPVSRYKLMHTSANQEQIVARIMGGDGWKEIARYLMVEGGFNVNSVSEEAWAAMLQGLCRRELVSNTRSRLHRVDHSQSDEVLFSRFMVSTADRPTDGHRGYNMLLGAAFLRPSLKMATAWGDVRSLDSDSIRSLAREIVKQVRARGPFLNMSDFINRRLDGGTDAALTGALQAAIDATDINDHFKRADFRVTPMSGSFYKFPRAEEGSMYTAAPGYLIQSDVLASLGNILTVRDDTFTVRSYGCVRNARRAILAQAWCEAVVQRTIDFVDPTDSPAAGSYDPSNNRGSGSNVSQLSEVNRLMGRRFRVVSFKWLDAWDI